MKSDSTSQGDLLQDINEKLAETFYINGQYNALFLGVAGIGFAVIYLLTRFSLLGDPAPQLLYISGAVFLLAASQFPVLGLARGKKGIAANFLGTLVIIIFAIFLALFWQGVAPVAILFILITPLASIPAGMPRKYLVWLFGLAAVGIAGILYADANSAFDRIQTNTTPAITSLVFLGATILLLIAVTIIARSKSFRSIQNQLLTSFIIIVTVPALMAITLSTIGSYVNNETQALNTLETISTLKENQITTLVKGFENNSLKIKQDPDFARSSLILLTPGNINPAERERNQTIARARLSSFQDVEREVYREILVLNINGEAVVSTDPQREGFDFQAEPLFRQGIIKLYEGLSKESLFGETNLIVATPILDADSNAIRGVLVLRTDIGALKDIMQSTSGFEESETYLVDKDFRPITQTRTQTETVETQSSQDVILNGVPEGKGAYKNYAGEPVLGYYKWFEPLKAIIVAETPRSFVLTNLLGTLAGSTVLALFTILIAIAAVAISVNSISNPISALAQTARDFAAGKLSARAVVDREDEIGALARSYNLMAEQLQDIIGKLEQRVADRTEELRNQTFRLRVAAEIARDAASLHDLGDLLERAVQLIQDRFGFYHTGIFLLDNSKEFAVLTASPTEAGRQMIARDHKIRVGDAGIVGRVAATGEPRITLDTRLDATHLNNPLLPNTLSEMTLPLKVENNLIGVLDVQSDQTAAFDQDDITVMQILADQLATAIERTRLLQQVEQNLSELEQAYGRFTREGWKTLSEGGLLSNTGYRFDNIRIQPINEAPAPGNEAMQTGNTILHGSEAKSSEQNIVAIPIKLRGQSIGVVTAKLKEGYSQHTIPTIELAIERLAASMESARLYEEARLRADREQSISQVTAAISSSTEYEEILRTTVREIGNMLKDTEVAVQILDGSGDSKTGN